MLRVDESLFWVNAARVKERVLEIADDQPDTKALILDLESTDQLEITSSDMLAMLLERLRSRGSIFYLVRVRFHVRTVLGNTGMRPRSARTTVAQHLPGSSGCSCGARLEAPPEARSHAAPGTAGGDERTLG